jgi:hypothetical protein
MAPISDGTEPPSSPSRDSLGTRGKHRSERTVASVTSIVLECPLSRA